MFNFLEFLFYNITEIILFFIILAVLIIYLVERLYFNLHINNKYILFIGFTILINIYSLFNNLYNIDPNLDIYYYFNNYFIYSEFILFLKIFMNFVFILY